MVQFQMLESVTVVEKLQIILKDAFQHPAQVQKAAFP